MDNIIVITQNLELDSLENLRSKIKEKSETLIFSSQLVFENERIQIQKVLGSKCIFLNFSDLMTDEDFEKCDVSAYENTDESLSSYYDRIKRIKNEFVIKQIVSKYNCPNRFLLCTDLGIKEEIWEDYGFKKIKCRYYYTPTTLDSLTNFVRKHGKIIKEFLTSIIYTWRVSKHEADWDGTKYVFYGSMNRIDYRLNIEFKESPWIRSAKDVIIVLLYKLFRIIPSSNIVRMSTLHERGISRFPDSKKLNLKLIQDGYLPPNYASKYLLFNGKNIEYYTWDVEGGKTFDYHNLKHRVIPFRKKLYLPSPFFPIRVKKVLCVASGAGDWTALKNRSDEDKMLQVFGEVAKSFPDIEFVYRCHPVWIHPSHQGVNSINRAIEYVHWLNLPNFTISSNIPNAHENGKFILSYKRSSFEEDLEGVDVVFGEHSISQIDAAFKNILFCSVNVTGRRNFFKGITDMGFPYCENKDEICALLKDIATESFKTRYKNAIKNYNTMTDKEL